MFDWLKKRKQSKELKQNLMELKKMILEINITEDASGTELEEFYSKVAIWARVLSEKQIEFFAAMGALSPADKIELLNHIDTCVRNYGAKMVKLNAQVMLIYFKIYHYF